MPNYPWLERNVIDGQRTADSMNAMRIVGVPYTDADIAAATDEVKGKNELQAIVAYLQVLGTMVKFDETKDYRK